MNCVLICVALRAKFSHDQAAACLAARAHARGGKGADGTAEPVYGGIRFLYPNLDRF